MLGRELVEFLRGRGTPVTAAARIDLDITDPAAVDAAVLGHSVVVNAAAWTDVDGAESAERSANVINAEGPANLARACQSSGARLVQISTDYVFAGTADQPYREDAPTSPVNAYGRTKLGGERAVRDLAPEQSIVLRTSWLYGQYGASFVRTIARLEAERETIDVVDDQHGQPTWTGDVAARIVGLVEAGVGGGVWHATNAGSTTWHGLARAVFEEIGADPERVRPVSSDRFPRPAPRPAYSVLGDDAAREASVPPMRPWRTALADAAPELFHHRARLA